MKKILLILCLIIFITGCAGETSTLTGSGVTVNKAGTGDGTVMSSPEGINCGQTCAANFDDNTVVTLTATPAEDSEFKEWTGACSGTSICSVTVSGASLATATFNSNPLTFALPANLPAATVGVEYTYNFAATAPRGGNPPYKFQLATGAGFPPFGITVRPRSGDLGGKPTTVETRGFDICVVDSKGYQTCSNTSLTVNPADAELSGHWEGPYDLTVDISFFCADLPTLTHEGDIAIDILESNGKITGTGSLDGIKSITIDGTGACSPAPGPSFSGTVTGDVDGEDISLTIDFGDPDLFMNAITIDGSFKGGEINGDIISVDGPGSVSLKKK